MPPTCIWLVRGLAYWTGAFVVTRFCHLRRPDGGRFRWRHRHSPNAHRHQMPLPIFLCGCHFCGFTHPGVPVARTCERPLGFPLMCGSQMLRIAEKAVLLFRSCTRCEGLPVPHPSCGHATPASRQLACTSIAPAPSLLPVPLCGCHRGRLDNTGPMPLPRRLCTLPR